jgi:hypothetical protein
MEEMQYYKKSIERIMKREFLTKSVLCLRIDITYNTLQKLFDGDNEMKPLSKMKIKKFVDEYEASNGNK